MINAIDIAEELIVIAMRRKGIQLATLPIAKCEKCDYEKNYLICVDGNSLNVKIDAGCRCELMGEVESSVESLMDYLRNIEGNRYEFNEALLALGFSGVPYL